MYQIILLFHVFVAVLIITLVLVQQGKGATMGAAFGSGASQTVFGSRGSGSFLFKVTMGFAIAFFATSIILNNMATQAYKADRVLTMPEPAPASAAGAQTMPATTAPVTESTTEKTTNIKETGEVPVTPSDLPKN